MRKDIFVGMTMNKKIELTPEEIEMIADEIHTSKSTFESLLECQMYDDEAEKEDFISNISVADNILDKLGK